MIRFHTEEACSLNAHAVKSCQACRISLSLCIQAWQGLTAVTVFNRRLALALFILFYV